MKKDTELLRKVVILRLPVWVRKPASGCLDGVDVIVVVVGGGGVLSTLKTEIHLSGADEPVDSKPLIMPLAHALAIEVVGLGEQQNTTKPSLGITASSGYSLPAGQFCCPDGLFACLPPSETIPIGNRTWSQRICLPQSLRCDGVVNCPLGDSDEQNCSDPLPVEFPPIPVDESEQFVTYLRTVRPVRLITEAGYASPPSPAFGIVIHQAQAAWYSLIVSAALILVVLLICSIWLLRSVCKRRPMKRLIPFHNKWPRKLSDSGPSSICPRSQPTDEYGDDEDNEEEDAQWIKGGDSFHCEQSDLLINPSHGISRHLPTGVNRVSSARPNQPGTDSASRSSAHCAFTGMNPNSSGPVNKTSPTDATHNELVMSSSKNTANGGRYTGWIPLSSSSRPASSVASVTT
ncbi:unnamed protein product [Echinostoma caproni]|uniref:Low-density lipoprotein receptor domain class A n=1 Tax=Echinostoma caproni TaxID=27848 RepID=A0A183AY21_9TREM|nr:unnamed protein product [Echinostoma caproni]